MVSPSQLHKEITAGRFKPAYYFFGSEDYRIAEAEKFVAHQFLPDKQLVTNYHKIDAARTSTPDLINELSALPMLGERQVFAIYNFQSCSPTDVDRVLKMVDRQVSDRVIIFSSPSAKTPKKNSAFYKKISEAAETVEFRRLTEKEMAQHVKGRLKEAGIAIEAEALKLFCELIAGNRGALVAETAKLVDFKQAGEVIKVDEVRQLTAGHEVFGIFEVADLVIQGNARRVLQSIESLLAGGYTPSTLVT
ncbi:MAG: DNA polymerase III subunit delta, partial [Candidatus Zixiibacteriota bacterium]